MEVEGVLGSGEALRRGPTLDLVGEDSQGASISPEHRTRKSLLDMLLTMVQPGISHTDLRLLFRR